MIDPCGARIKLKKLIEDYVTKPLCPSCGRDSLKLDSYQAKINKLKTCKCSMWPYPHQKGNKLGCIHSTKTFDNEEEYRDMIMDLQSSVKD